MTDCPFCSRIANSDVVLSNELAVAFPDGYPVSAGHMLIVPRRHIEDFFSLTAEEQAAIWNLVAPARRHIETQHAPDGYNLGINVGPSAGQTVPHAHFHIIPRYAGDVADPRGGIRWVLPSKAVYWRQP
jgi:diadenosine tetraphosphate (Ap4A) HIT family hydrolase